jgi:hypothetical protein
VEALGRFALTLIETQAGDDEHEVFSPWLEALGRFALTLNEAQAGDDVEERA